MNMCLVSIRGQLVFHFHSTLQAVEPLNCTSLTSHTTWPLHISYDMSSRYGSGYVGLARDVQNPRGRAQRNAVGKSDTTKPSEPAFSLGEYTCTIWDYVFWGLNCCLPPGSTMCHPKTRELPSFSSLHQCSFVILHSPFSFFLCVAHTTWWS